MSVRRVLFVDDDLETCEMYEQLQTYWGIGQEVHTAENGKEALELMNQKKFDVVVSDLAMPDMPGLDFLSQVMEAHPEAARIVISGHADHLKAAEALNVAHRYFSKPFDFTTLGALLERLCSYYYLLHNERIRRMIYKTGALPVLPSIWTRLTEILNSPYSGIDDVAAVVEQDPGLASRLLHTVNSAHFGIARKVVSCSEAIQIVGLEVVRSLMMGIQIFDFYQKSPFVRSVFGTIWNHSLQTAIGARKLAEFQGEPNQLCNITFIAALLHDVGKLIFAANAEPEYRMVMELAAKSGVPVEQAELGTFGCDHAQIGAYLFALWGFPDPVVQAVENHHALAKIDAFCPALAIHLAQTLEPGSTQEKRLNTALIEQLGLSGKVPLWRAALSNQEAH